MHSGFLDSRLGHAGLFDVSRDGIKHRWRKSQIEEPISNAASLFQL